MKCDWCKLEKDGGKSPEFEFVTYNISVHNSDSYFSKDQGTFAHDQTSSIRDATPVKVFICNDCISLEHIKNVKQYKNDQRLSLVFLLIGATLLTILPLLIFIDNGIGPQQIPLPVFLVMLGLALISWYFPFLSYNKMIGKEWAVKKKKYRVVNREDTFSVMLPYLLACIAQERGHSYYSCIDDFSINKVSHANLDEYKKYPWSRKLTYTGLGGVSIK